MLAFSRALPAGTGIVRRTMAGACLLLLLAILAAPAIVLGAAEQTAEGSSASAQESKAGPQAMPPGPEPRFGPGMMGRHHAEPMCPDCPMRGPHMGGGHHEGHMDPGMCMMGMMGMIGPMGDPKDPKAAGRMLQMRGEMLKAIGDIMTKHGKAMEEGH